MCMCDPSRWYTSRVNICCCRISPLTRESWIAYRSLPELRLRAAPSEWTFPAERTERETPNCRRHDGLSVSATNGPIFSGWIRKCEDRVSIYETYLYGPSKIKSPLVVASRRGVSLGNFYSGPNQPSRGLWDVRSLSVVALKGPSVMIISFKP